MQSQAYRRYSRVKGEVEGQKVEVRVCRHCPADTPTRYSIGSSTTTLQKHVDQKHNGAPPPLRSTWKDYHMQLLESAGAEWKPQAMRDTVDVLKRKILAWVRGQTEQEGEVVDAVDAD